MATKRKKKRTPKKTYRFQLTLQGIAGVGVVCFCLFLWMFLLGIWAGQTFLLPTAKSGEKNLAAINTSGNPSVETLDELSKKKPGAK